MKIVVLQLECIGHADVGQRPASITIVLLIVGTVLQPYTEVVRRLAQDLFRVVLAAIRDGRVFLPLDAGEAAYPADHATELIRHLPGGVEGTNAARRQTGKGMTVSVFADVVLSRGLGQKLVTQKADI